MTLRGTLRLLVLCATTLVACSEGPTGPNVGTLRITIVGLPAGTAAAVTVEGPDGFSAEVGTSTDLTALPSGEYIVTADTTTVTEDLYAAAQRVDTVRIARGRRSHADPTYALVSGSITFTTAGLPAGVTGEAILEGPGDAERTVAIPATVRGLVAGEWVLRFPRRYSADGHGYDTPTPDTVEVFVGDPGRLIAATYTLATGAITATFNGLPDSVAPLGYVFGTYGIVATMNASGTRAGFDPGSYTIAPQNVFDGDIRYSATSVTQTVSVGLTPRAYSINYVPRSGRLTLEANGLPGGATATARVTSAGGLDTTLSVGDTLKGLPTGGYTVQGQLIESGGTFYSAPELELVPVLGAQTAVATLEYSSGGGFDVVADAAYAVQAVQRFDGSVPLVAGRDAMIRVFARATALNSFAAPARIRILQGMTTVFEQTVAATWTGIPTVADQSTFEGSWRVNVAGALIQPGAQLQVTVDPAESLPDDDRANNTLTVPLDVRALPTFRARFVPIRFSAGGAAGAVNAGNSGAFLQLTRDMMPVSDVDVDLRAEYVTNQPRLTTSNGAVWENVLGELNALRVIESSQRYYMGIIPVGYTSGIAGIAYLGTPTSLTWDYLPSGSEVLAHELGHNFDRYHAPCGNPGGPDPAYPHPGGDIGAYGWDARLSRLRIPDDKDIMSYCDDPWVSDYTWENVVDFREENEPLLSISSASQTVLLLRGRVTPNGVEIEPSFALDAAPKLPRPGPHQLEIRDASGRVVYSASFRASPVPHAEVEGTEHFTFAIPLSALGGREAAEIAVSSRFGSQRMRSPAQAPRGGTTVRVDRDAAGNIRVSDSDAATTGLIIRDAASGRVISIVRGREMTLPGHLGELEVLSSTGVRSSTLRIRPPLR